MKTQAQLDRLIEACQGVKARFYLPALVRLRSQGHEGHDRTRGLVHDGPVLAPDHLRESAAAGEVGGVLFRSGRGLRADWGTYREHRER